MPRAHSPEPIDVLLATEADVLLARFRTMTVVVVVKVTEDVMLHKHVIVHFDIVVMPSLELGPQLWPAPEPEVEIEPEPDPEPEPQPQLAPDAELALRDSHGRAPPTQELPDAKREPDAGGENDDWGSWTLGQFTRMELIWRGRAAVPIDEQDDSSFQKRQRNAVLVHPRKDVLACLQYHAAGSIAKVVELLVASALALKVGALVAQALEEQVPERIAFRRDAETALYMVPSSQPQAALTGQTHRLSVITPVVVPLEAEYLRKARAQDRVFDLALPGPHLNGPNASIGPIEVKLNTVKPIRGIVIGAFGEVSADTHSLVKEIAAQGGRKMYALMGVSPMEAAARIKKQLIDTIGTIAERGHAQLLLARLSALAPITAQRGNTTNSNQQIISLNALAGLPGHTTGDSSARAARTRLEPASRVLGLLNRAAQCTRGSVHERAIFAARRR
ncbi:hypothetical protein T492DRAFT_861083 [Pavlovales sp. CCMP2436]|nr:hypothetical protein T492DRAFT_861083 [Pavlovales sp. CCMP2436]